MFELDEVKEHFRQLDLKARDNYQTVSIGDLDRIDWLIEQAEKVEQLEKEKPENTRTGFDEWINNGMK